MMMTIMDDNKYTYMYTYIQIFAIRMKSDSCLENIKCCIRDGIVNRFKSRELNYFHIIF